MPRHREAPPTPPMRNSKTNVLFVTLLPAL